MIDPTLGEMMPRKALVRTVAPSVLRGEARHGIGAVAIVDGRAIGATGCGGETGEQDHERAVAGPDAVARG
jgi:uncharacterized protein GlcG (DUF336 family)